MDCSPPDFSVHGISQAILLEWLAVPFSRESSRLRDRTQVSYIEGRFFTIWATRGAQLRLTELLGWNTDPIGLVSSWSKTPENYLCVSVSFPLSLFPTHHPVWGWMENPAWEERVLTRTSPCWHPDLGLLAPRTVRKEISVVYFTESIVFFYGILGWQIQNLLF